MLTEYGPLGAALAAALAAVLAYLASRRRPQLAPEQADKLRSEIANDQLARDKQREQANITRDRHIVRMEKWGFEIVRPWSRKAATIIGDQNDLLVELAARAEIDYTPTQLEPLAEMPQIDDNS